MTDIGVPAEHDHSLGWTIPSRLGTVVSHDGGVFSGELRSIPATVNGGALRASAVVFLVDAVAGLALDTDPEMWCFTSDLSVRMPVVPAPERLLAHAEITRAGARSASAAVPIDLPDGSPFGLGLLGFVRVARRPGDPDKPRLDAALLTEMWSRIPLLDQPVREAAGIRVLDAGRGEVELSLRADLLNPAGALQGAMVALLAEAAAEELATAAAGQPQVVTDLDVRYLAQGRGGPLRSRARFVGPPADGSVVVDLVDTALADRLLATVTLRTRPAPHP